MSLGYADEGGLANFDEDAAAENLANVGKDLQFDAPAIAPVEAPIAPLIPDLPQGGPEPVGSHTPDLAGSTPAPATQHAGDYPDLPMFEALAEPPKPPPLTGDPAKDNALNVQWQRDLADYRQHLTDRQTAINNHTTRVNSVAAGKQADVQERALKARQEELAHYQVQRKARQDSIDAAINERAAARRDLEGGNQDDKLHGGRLVAMIAGGLGQALMNTAMIQRGMAPNAQNMGLVAIEKAQAKRYDQKKLRLANAGDALLEARYGAKDADEAHRAALNDLDANQAAEWKLIGLEAERQLRQMGASKEDIARNEIILTARQKQAENEGKIHEREEGHQIQKEQAAATLALAAANLGEKKHEFGVTSGERRREFDAREADRLAAAKDRKAAADDRKAAKDETTAVRVGGQIQGHVATPRNVQAAETRFTNYGDAQEALEELLKYQKKNPNLGRLPMGDRYDRAILAVAAVTTANASDATTAHEANTIKSYGLASPEATKRTLDHLKRRRAEFLRNLSPPTAAERAQEPNPVPPETGGGEKKAAKSGFSAGGATYELGADGNYHKVK